MSREREIVGMLIEIKEDISQIKQQLSDYPEVKKRVEKHTIEIAKAKNSLSLIRWLAGAILITVPATVAAVVRAWR